MLHNILVRWVIKLIIQCSSHSQNKNACSLGHFNYTQLLTAFCGLLGNYTLLSCHCFIMSYSLQMEWVLTFNVSLLYIPSIYQLFSLCPLTLNSFNTAVFFLCPKIPISVHGFCVFSLLLKLLGFFSHQGFFLYNFSTYSVNGFKTQIRTKLAV